MSHFISLAYALVVFAYVTLALACVAAGTHAHACCALVVAAAYVALVLLH